ncbi:hypothetical protein [Undibacterium sp. Xuan67W]|uniref:hypothetical protein n=1 Tax=Undibacterium sp. Xuan67W TaxID=3413057 RepID=UPI003BF2AE00
MANQELASCVFLSACIIEKDYFYFSTRLDALPSDEYFHARLSTYDQGAWNKHDREQQVVSVCVMRQTETENTRAYCALELASGKIEVWTSPNSVDI